MFILWLATMAFGIIVRRSDPLAPEIAC